MSGKVVSNPAMIDISSVSWADYGWIWLAFCLSMWLISSAIAGFEKTVLPGWERIARLVCAIAILVPSQGISLAALVIAAMLVILHRRGITSADMSSA